MFKTVFTDPKKPTTKQPKKPKKQKTTSKVHSWCSLETKHRRLVVTKDKETMWGCRVQGYEDERGKWRGQRDENNTIKHSLGCKWYNGNIIMSPPIGSTENQIFA